MAEYVNIKKGDKTPLSAIYLYVKELEAEGNLGNDGGASSMELGGTTLKKVGICPDTMMPYPTPAQQVNPSFVKKVLSTLPNAAQTKAAMPYKLTSTTAVPGLAEAKQQLAKGNPVAMGLMLYQSFETVGKDGMVPMPDMDNEQLLGGHAVLAVGYDDARKVLIMRNSWSTGWGDKGYFYIPYTYVNNDLVLDCWTGQ